MTKTAMKNCSLLSNLWMEIYFIMSFLSLEFKNLLEVTKLVKFLSKFKVLVDE